MVKKLCHHKLTAVYIQYFLQMDNLNVTRFDKGVAKCPFNPHANITTLMTDNGQMFVGSPTDFSGSDPAILRTDVSQVCTIHVLPSKKLFFYVIVNNISN